MLLVQFRLCSNTVQYIAKSASLSAAATTAWWQYWSLVPSIPDMWVHLLELWRHPGEHRADEGVAKPTINQSQISNTYTGSSCKVATAICDAYSTFKWISIPECRSPELVESGGVAGGVVDVAVALRPYPQVIPVHGVQSNNPTNGSWRSFCTHGF